MRTPLDRWELVHRVAEGSWAEVYRARPADGAPAAAAYCLKRLKPGCEADSQAISLLRREARVGRAVTSPHLVPVLETHVEQAPFFVVMPWIEGATLAVLQASATERTVPLPTALWIARQVAEALTALDAAGWTHSDVKPANIMVSPAGHATLLDLAFARRPDDEDRSRECFIAGTPWYMAPETLLSTMRPDIRSDIYSLGAVLYEMLAGRLPFTATDAAELITAHRQAEPPNVRELAPDVPKTVAALLHEMLSKEPLRRPQSPAEVVKRLTALEIESFGDE